MKKILCALLIFFLCDSIVLSQTRINVDVNNPDSAKDAALDYMIGGVFGAVTVEGKNYQQIGLRPEIKIFKLGIGLDISLLLDENGKVREEDWDQKEDYIDKIYYIRYGQKGDPFYFRFGGLDSTTLGYGAIINGYTNMLEYPTYKRQGIDIGFETSSFGMQAIVNDFKELQGRNKAVMGGGRIYLKPFSRLHIGASIAGDLNEYKGLRDSDDDGYPDEIDAYPNDSHYVTEIDYYRGKLNDANENTVIQELIAAGLISPIEKSDLVPYSDKRSRTGFWSGDAALLIIDGDFVKFNVYSQYAQSMNTGGWGYSAPGLRITFVDIIELYGDYRQQSDKFIFGYYNDTYDLERAKYVSDGSNNLYVVTKKDRLEEAERLKGYFGGLKINFFNIFTGKAEYQDMRWGKTEKEDKSLRGELVLNKDLLPMLSKAKAYYVQNNVEKLEWKTESTVIGAVVGIMFGENVSIDFNYRITYEDKNGDGKIKGDDEEITNISVSTSALF
ncbi:MAG TPA: hypothetical protein PLA51_07155 [Spirochaetota bacterium]|nr:hypothetical protein [Spirochaetota bacterium]